MILDTCFLIDAQRQLPETKAFLIANASEALSVTAITVGELACGFDHPDLPKLSDLLRRFQILEVTAEAGAHYGASFRRLRSLGKMIGSNDLWIASVALAHRLPVVTRNVEEFTRVPGLHVLGY